MHLAQRVAGGAVGGSAMRHVDDDAAGRVPPPRLREGKHVGALARRQTAAIAAEKDFDRLHAFREGDRVAFAIIVGVGLDRRFLRHTAGERGDEAHGSQDPQCGRMAMPGWRREKAGHRSVAPAQSRMNPYLPWLVSLTGWAVLVAEP